MLTKIKLIGFAILIFIPRVCLSATSYTASTCSRADVSTAESSCEGDGECTGIVIPTGECNWTGAGGITVSVAGKSQYTISGSGSLETIITDNDGGTLFNITNGGDSIRVTNIKMLSNIGCSLSCSVATPFEIRNSGFFRLDNLHIEGYFQHPPQWKSLTKGLIDSCYFKNTNASGSNTYYGITAGMPSTGSHEICNVSVCDCDAGEETSNRASSVVSGNTVISGAAAVINNVGGAGTGTVRRIYINMASSTSGTVNVASFVNTSGTTFDARAATTGLTVYQGLNIFSVDDGDFTPFAINNGDYIGAYLNNATIEAATGATGWTVAGDQTNQSGVDFGSADIGAISLWVEIFDDEGAYSACEGWWTSFFTDTSRGGGYFLGVENNWTDDGDGIYIEGCTFDDWYKTIIEGNWGGSSLFFVRYNNIGNSSGEVLTGVKPGNTAQIFYNNLFQHTGGGPAGNTLRYRVDGMVYDNEFRDLSTVGVYMSARNYGNGGDTNYYFPFWMRQNELYVWNNTLNSMGCGSTMSDCWDTETENDEWMSGVGEGGTVHFRAPISGERLYNFTEYTCPHPATGYTGSCGDGAGVSYYNVGGNPGTGSCAGGGSGSAAGGGTGSMLSQ